MQEGFQSHDYFYKYIESTDKFIVVETKGSKSRKKYRLIESFDTLDEARDFIVDTNYIVWYTKLPKEI
tara:strand:+ start:213 stop:416 length:204 start_codon:yes stop_codon:yes gene_type:complete